MVFPETGPSIVICSLSMWFFSSAIAFFYYPENEVINSYLYCSLIPLGLLVGIEFAFLFFIDFLHIFPLIAIGIILWKKRSTIKLRNVAITSLVLIIWVAIVRLVGVNYTGIPIFPEGLVMILFWPILTLLPLYIANHMKQKKN